MKKRSFFIIILLLFLLSINDLSFGKVYSNGINYTKAETRASSFMYKYFGSDVYNPKKLYNINGEIQAIIYDVLPKGYVIIDVCNYSIPEFRKHRRESSIIQLPR